MQEPQVRDHAVYVSDDGIRLGSGRVPSHRGPGVERLRRDWSRHVWSDSDFMPRDPHPFSTFQVLNWGGHEPGSGAALMPLRQPPDKHARNSSKSSDRNAGTPIHGLRITPDRRLRTRSRRHFRIAQDEHFGAGRRLRLRTGSLAPLVRSSDLQERNHQRHNSAPEILRRQSGSYVMLCW
jgi:hypothetical protein